MKKIAKIGFIVMTVAGVILTIVAYKIGGFDRLGWRENRISITDDLTKELNGNLVVKFVSGLDTFDIYKHRFLAVKELSDWYGKDHLLVCVGKNSLKCGYGEYKFKSFEKLDISINVHESIYNKDYYVVEYHLESIFKKYDKRDSICVNRNIVR